MNWMRIVETTGNINEETSIYLSVGSEEEIL